MTNSQIARDIWKTIKESLEDHGVLNFDGLREKTLQELEDKQVATIFAGLMLRGRCD